MDFDPVAWINTPRWQASRLGLERVADLLERMGRPQDALRFVHVAGTNGKGSVCAYLDAVLRAAGCKVGLFTSPFIECFEERIRVNGENISTGDLARATAVVRWAAEEAEAACGDHPTEFELMFAVACEYFRAMGCDVVVLEVGLGGRLDATNVIDAPEVAVICRIGLDHTDLLGDTLAAVAREKAGIVKAGSPVVSWPQEPEAASVIEAVAAARGCSLSVPDFAQLAVEPLAPGTLGESAGGCASALAGAVPVPMRRFRYRGQPFQTALLGSYQPANAVLALEVVRVLRGRGWGIPEKAVQAGIASARWPGRFEVVATAPLTIIDGGHNPQGAAALAASLADLLGEGGRGAGIGGEGDCDGAAPAACAAGGVTFVAGVLADKDYPAMVAAVAPWARAFVTYMPPSPRALSGDDLAAHIRQAHDLPAEEAPTPAAALARARAEAGPGGVVVAFGTLYAIADLRRGL